LLASVLFSHVFLKRYFRPSGRAGINFLV
jgi:hypothetical protein